MPWRQMGVYFIVGSTLCVGAAYSFNLKRSYGQLSATVVEHQAQQPELRADNAHLQAQLAEKNAQYALLDARIDGLEASLSQAPIMTEHLLRSVVRLRLSR